MAIFLFAIGAFIGLGIVLLLSPFVYKFLDWYYDWVNGWLWKD